MKNEKSNSLSLPKGFGKYAEMIGEYAKKDRDRIKASSVMVALSGGADSVALFDLTARLCEAEGGYFYACHVNHGIRGDEAIRDRDFCISLAKSTPTCREIFVLDTDVPAIAEESGESIESAARRVRYEFFEQVMRENEIPVLLTAHNADDNLETLIFNLVRGSGAKGMRGIPPVRMLDSGKLVVRPIIKMSKSEILDYCEERGLSFVTDSTNFDTDYSRNLIRQEVVPLLERINSRLRTHATELSGDMRELYSLAEREAMSIDDEGEGISLTSLAKISKSAFPEAIARGLERSGFRCELERVHVNALRELVASGEQGASVSLPNGVRARINYKKLFFEADSRQKPSRLDYEIPLKKGENLLPDGSVLLITDECGDEDVYKFATKVNFNFDTTNIIAKNRREGDKIRVKGINKSVKKLMCDQKLDSSLRDRIPLVFADGVLICIPGVAVCDEAYTKKEKGTLLAWLEEKKEN